MVGGLADWFAVTAMFRRPLGLPIPHTAIIPAKKDQIGEGLATFVREYFLTTEVVSERVSAAHVPERMGQWLADPTHARRLSEELSIAVSGMAGMLRDDQIRDAVAGFADRRLRELDIAPLLARLIDAVCDSGQHQATPDAVPQGHQEVPGRQPRGVPPPRRRAVLAAVVRRRAAVQRRLQLDPGVPDRRHRPAGARAARRLRPSATRAGRAAAKRPGADRPGRGRPRPAAGPPERARLPRQPLGRDEEAAAGRDRATPTANCAGR